MEIEILNPINPVTEKLERLVRSYARICMTGPEWAEVSKNFNDLLGMVNEILLGKNRDRIDAQIDMLAAWLSTKYRVKAKDLLNGMQFAKGHLMRYLD